MYSVASGKDKVIVGGWNPARKGRVREKGKDTWEDGRDIEKCYVIRVLVVAPK